MLIFYQLNYGASLLSFFGAVHCGLAMSNYTSVKTYDALKAMYPSATDETIDELSKSQKLITTSKQDSIRYLLSAIPFVYSWRYVIIHIITIITIIIIK